MNRRRFPGRLRERDFRVEAVPRQSPDLHKLAQVFLGMAVARAETETQRVKGSSHNEEAEVTMSEDGAVVE